MDGYRRAALALHGLSETDRHWMLARLREAERMQLTELIDELHMLGIPADPSLLAGVKDAAPVARRELSRLHEASANAMLALLAREPAGLMAILLRAERWPWAKSFLARLDPGLREAVVALLKNEAPVSERRSTMLVSRVEARLEEDAQTRPATRLARITAWTGWNAQFGREALSAVYARWTR